MAIFTIGAISGALLMSAMTMAALGPGIGDHFTRMLNNVFKGRVPDLENILRQHHKKIINDAQFIDMMDDIGFNADRAKNLLKASYNPLNVQEILTLWFRYNKEESNAYGINPAWLADNMLALGFNSEKHQVLIESNRPVPSLQDVIRFAVREVYDPVLREASGLDEGYEDNPRYVIEAGKRGLSPEDAKDFWAAHWELPGLHQVYEMLHRLYDHPDPKIQFTDKDMDAYFNVADIAPAYRKRLKEISYNPITRVDARRLYNLGVFGTGAEARAKVKRAYREIGFNETNAELMTLFTLDYYEESDRELTRSQILQFYREGVYGEGGRGTAKTQLEALNYASEYVEWMLTFEDLKEIDAEEADKIDLVRVKWLKGEIDNRVDLVTALAKIGLLITRINKLVTQFVTAREKQERKLPRTVADKLYKTGKMSAEDYEKYLEAHNYKTSDITLMKEYLDMPSDADVQIPNKADLKSFVTKNIITAEDFVIKMKEIGFILADSELYLQAYDMEFDPESLKVAYNE